MPVSISRVRLSNCVFRIFRLLSQITNLHRRPAPVFCQLGGAGVDKELRRRWRSGLYRGNRGLRCFFPDFPRCAATHLLALRRVMINHAVIIEAMDPANIALARYYSM